MMGTIHSNAVSFPVGTGGAEGSLLLTGPFKGHYRVEMYFSPYEGREITDRYEIIFVGQRRAGIETCRRLAKHFERIAAEIEGIEGAE